MSANISKAIKTTNSDLATGRAKWMGHLAMLVFAILIAGSFSIGHLAAPHIEPAALNAVRFVFACTIMGAAIAVRSRRFAKLPKHPWRLLILGALMATYFILMFTALKITGPVSTAAVFTLIPFMSAIFGWIFLRQVSRPNVLISLVIAGAGSIWMIFQGDINAIVNFDIGRGELIFLVGCACHAAYAPLVKKFNTGIDVLDFTFWTLVATTIWILIVGFNDILSTNWFALPTIVWWAIAYLSVFTTAITFFLVQFASMRLLATKVLAYGYLTPGVIILIEGMLGHGWVGISVGFGAIATIAGLLFLAFSPDN